jgi:hypothetical protein
LDMPSAFSIDLSNRISLHRVLFLVALVAQTLLAIV